MALLMCWVGIDSDITEMMATQAALRFANHELEAFSYTVSHDLRTPLLTLTASLSAPAHGVSRA